MFQLSKACLPCFKGNVIFQCCLCHTSGLYMPCFRAMSCFRTIYAIFQDYASQVSGPYKPCFSTISPMFQDHISHVSGPYLPCFRTISAMFQGHISYVSGPCQRWLFTLSHPECPPALLASSTCSTR